MVRICKELEGRLVGGHDQNTLCSCIELLENKYKYILNYLDLMCMAVLPALMSICLCSCLVAVGDRKVNPFWRLLLEN